MITEIFVGEKDFEATEKAEQWCKERRISVGMVQRGSPRGLLYGDCTIAKWRNLRAEDISALDGVMIGDGRRGPITVKIKDGTEDM